MQFAQRGRACERGSIDREVHADGNLAILLEQLLYFSGVRHAAIKLKGQADTASWPLFSGCSCSFALVSMTKLPSRLRGGRLFTNSFAGTRVLLWCSNLKHVPAPLLDSGQLSRSPCQGLLRPHVPTHSHLVSLRGINIMAYIFSRKSCIKAHSAALFTGQTHLLASQHAR
jgi:hypothetical protein